MHDLDRVDRLLALVADRVRVYRPFAGNAERWWAYCEDCRSHVDDFHRIARSQHKGGAGGTGRLEVVQ